jgi:heptosyltransferase-2
MPSATKKKKRDKQPKRSLFWQKVVYFLYIGLEKILSILPIGICFTIGRVAGRTAHFVLPAYRKLVRRNLRIAFEGEKNEEQIRSLAREHFVTLGANLICSFKIGTMTEEETDKHLEVKGLEHLQDAFQKKRGIIYLVSHLGNWEILAKTRAIIVPGIKRHSLYQSLSNPYLDEHVRKTREAKGTVLFSRADGFSAPMEALRKGTGLGVLVDQHAGDKGVWCPFFDRLASTSNLASLLAVRTKSAMFAVAIFTIGKAKWRLVIKPELEVRKDNIEQLTARINLVVEDLIRVSPADWFWVHNRWKTPNPAFLLKYYKRGVTLPETMAEDDLKRFRIIIRSPNWLGDACMAIPAVRAIKRGRPDARVTILSPEKIADVWRIVPEVDDVLTKPNKCSPMKVSRLIREAGQFDVAILLPNSPRSAFETIGTGIPRVVGYEGRWRKRIVNQIIPAHPVGGPPRHHVEHYLHLADAVGGDIQDPEIFSEPWARPLGGGSRRTRIGICAGAEYGDAKRWPLDRFAEAAKEVSAENPNCEWIIFGGPKEKALGEELSGMLDGNCRNLAGKTTLRELIHELRTCEALLTNDTGTMHLAAFIGVPTISIFGSTEPRWTGPIGDRHRVIRHHVECSPCFLRNCPLDFRCMKEIEPKEVADAVQDVLKGVN